MYNDRIIILAHKKALQKGFINRKQYNRLRHNGTKITNGLTAPIKLTDDGRAFIHGCGVYPLDIAIKDLLS